MNLRDVKTRKKVKGIIEKVKKSELKQLKKNKNFNFDWIQEAENEVYKISLETNKEILALISIINIPEEFRIHINLIESSIEQRGNTKTIQNIPGCLIAFACKMAFKKGYDGFVSLTPKTKLIDYYANIYGFIQIGMQMAVFDEKSNSIIKKYYGNEKV